MSLSPERILFLAYGRATSKAETRLSRSVKALRDDFQVPGPHDADVAFADLCR